MTETVDPSAFVEALAREIRAEMSRQGIRSLRAFSRTLGLSHSTLNTRLSYDIAPAARKPLGAGELFQISEKLGVEPEELVGRAMHVVRNPPPRRGRRVG